MTTDVRIIQSSSSLWDLTLDSSGDLDSGDFFDSSLAYSLLGERRASPSEVPTSSRRRGWIGNEGQGFENGSKLWLYEQSRLTRSTLNAIQSEAVDALLWLVEEGYAVNVQAFASLSGGNIVLEVFIYRFNSIVERRFFELWQNTGV